MIPRYTVDLKVTCQDASNRRPPIGRRYPFWGTRQGPDSRPDVSTVFRLEFLSLYLPSKHKSQRSPSPPLCALTRPPLIYAPHPFLSRHLIPRRQSQRRSSSLQPTDIIYCQLCPNDRLPLGSRRAKPLRSAEPWIWIVLYTLPIPN